MIHLPILNTVIPGNVSLFFGIICPIATFDIVGSDISTELVFDFDFDAQDKATETAGITA